MSCRPNCRDIHYFRLHIYEKSIVRSYTYRCKFKKLLFYTSYPNSPKRNWTRFKIISKNYTYSYCYCDYIWSANKTCVPHWTLIACIWEIISNQAVCKFSFKIILMFSSVFFGRVTPYKIWQRIYFKPWNVCRYLFLSICSVKHGVQFNTVYCPDLIIKR